MSTKRHHLSDEVRNALLGGMALPGFTEVYVNDEDRQRATQLLEIERCHRLFGNMMGGGCWSCGSKPAGFMFIELVGVRKRCMKCARLERIEGQELAEAKDRQAERKAYGQRIAAARTVFSSLTPYEQESLQKQIGATRLCDVEIPSGSPLWNQILMQLLEKELARAA